MEHRHWTMGCRYPRHYVAHSVPAYADRETIPWTTEPFVDIGSRLYPPTDDPIPASEYSTRVKTGYDDDFLYVVAELGERFAYGSVTGHNGVPCPYKDHDFEVFVDVSGTGYFYKEFETNLLNATYDVLWHASDGTQPNGVPCRYDDSDDDEASSSSQHLWCMNTSDHGAYPGGNWTMWAANDTTSLASHATLIANSTGMLQGDGGAASDDNSCPEIWTPWTEVNASCPAPESVGTGWSVEVRFPLRPSERHGGLLDTLQGAFGSGGPFDFSRFDPNAPAPEWGPRYWWVNFARAEHPMGASSSSPFAPLENATQCQQVKDAHDTLLGNTSWSCYWEWVWQEMGSTQYMHYPAMWGIVEFADSPGEEDSEARPCLNIEWPGRYIASQIYWAQVAHFRSLGTFAKSVGDLLSGAFCEPLYCDIDDLAFAVGDADVFTMEIAVDADATSCVLYDSNPALQNYTGGPCFTATVDVAIPESGGHRYRVEIHEDRFVTVHHHSTTAGTDDDSSWLCLNDFFQHNNQSKQN